MNKLIIYQYINKITKNDILKYANNQGIKIDGLELDIVYDYIKNDYNRIINNPNEVLFEIRGNVSDCLYEKILELYDKYKDILDKLK